MTMMQPTAERKSAWIPWVFVAFFGVVLVANSIMLYVAFSTWTGIGEENRSAYARGLAYNERLAAVEEQRALGWQVGYGFDATAPGRGTLWMTLADAHGNLIGDADVTARVARPTNAAEDFATVLRHAGPGLYAVEVDFPLAGRWDVWLAAEHDQGTYRLTREIRVR